MAGSYAFLAWQLCITRMASFLPRRGAARGSASAGARTLDRLDRLDYDDDGNDDDGNDDDGNDDDGTMIDMGVVVGVGVGGGGSEILDQVDDDDDDDGLPRTKKSGAPKHPAPKCNTLNK